MAYKADRDREYCTLSGACEYLKSGGNVVDWCGLNLKVYNDAIHTINEDFSESFVCKNNSNNLLYFFQSGVCVLEDESEMLIINALTRQSYVSSTLRFKPHFRGSLLLCDCGLELPRRALLKVMGKLDFGRYLKQREEFFNGWRREYMGPLREKIEEGLGVRWNS